MLVPFDLRPFDFPMPFSADDEFAFDDLADLLATRFPAVDWLVLTADDGTHRISFAQRPEQHGGPVVVIVQPAERGVWEAVDGLGEDGAVLASSRLSAGDAAVGAGMELLRDWLPAGRMEQTAVVPRQSKSSGNGSRFEGRRDAAGPGPSSAGLDDPEQSSSQGDPSGNDWGRATDGRWLAPGPGRHVLFTAAGDGRFLLAFYRSIRTEYAHHRAENRAAHLERMRRSRASLDAAKAVMRRVEEVGHG